MILMIEKYGLDQVGLFFSPQTLLRERSGRRPRGREGKKGKKRKRGLFQELPVFPRGEGKWKKNYTVAIADEEGKTP
jgi:hypothetical protein